MTAVEWLVKEFSKDGLVIDLWEKEIDQAKEMEKEQLEEKYLKGIENYDPTFKKK